MSNWFRETWLEQNWVRMTGASLLVCAGTAVPLALGQQTPSTTPDAQQAAYDENSVLVAIRNANSSTNSAKAVTSDAETLEPTSEIAERTPDLAEIETPTTGWQSRTQRAQVQPAQPAPISRPATNTNIAPSTNRYASTATAEEATKAAPQKDEEGGQFGAALADVVRSQPGARAKLYDAAKGGAAVDAAGKLIDCEPAKFQGIQPGKSTREELLAAWGKPAESSSSSEGTVLSFDIEPFQAVEVLVGQNGIVAALKITFTGGLDSKELAKQLSLEEFQPVTIADERSRPLGEAFPERGVSFMFDPTSRSTTIVTDGAFPVLQVAIQSLDARAFALRAENHLHGSYRKNISDLKTAIALDPGFTHARWLLAEIYLATGQADLALAESTAALDLESNNSAYKLRHGQAAMMLGQFDDAVHEIRGVLDQADTSPVVRAQR